MKITAFNPLILTKDAEATIALYEALGFERRHTKSGIEGNVTSVTMRYTGDDGKVMSVRGFDEAYQLLEERGFKNAQGDKITETGTSKATMMVSPSGVPISLTEHIRTEDK